MLSSDSWPFWERVRYYWKNCRRWYRRDARNRRTTWAIVGLLVLLAVWAIADEPLERELVLVQEYEVRSPPVVKGRPWTECGTGYGISWGPWDDRQSWGAWRCGETYIFEIRDYGPPTRPLYPYSNLEREIVQLAPDEAARGIVSIIEHLRAQEPGLGELVE